MEQRRAAITAIGHFLPEERLTNADLEKLVDTSDEWIRTRTGIRERRILRDPDKATSYMASKAAKELLQKRNLDPSEIDLVIVATVTPDMFFPATACIVAAEIGAVNAWAYDISAACSGFLFALSTGTRFIESGKHEKVLVIGADKTSTIVDYSDRMEHSPALLAPDVAVRRSVRILIIAVHHSRAFSWCRDGLVDR